MSANLFVMIGPSAVGKNAILSRLRGSHRRVKKVVSATTRPPRHDERDGVDYRFVTRDQFVRMEKYGMLAEWTEFEGHLYGTPIDLLHVRDNGTRHVAVVDTVGAKAIKAKLGDGAVTIFVMPPSEDALRRRFEGRGPYEGEDIDGRMERARRDMAMAGDFDHIVVNDDVELAVAEVARIMGLRQSRESALAAGAPDYLVVYGSRLYGTDTPESDADERGFVIPPFEYIAGLCRFDQMTAAEPCDRIVWSLARFISMLLAGDPQAYEMLFAPDDKVIACSQAGRRVRDARTLFACTRFHRRIMGYAQAEWRKVRGVTLEPVRRTMGEETVVEDIRAVFAPGKEEMDEVLRLLFLNHERTERKATRKLGDKRKRQIDKFGFCASSASHSVRLMGELEELLLHGRLTFPRLNAEWLRAVKEGRVPFAEVEAEFEAARGRADAASRSTSLPDKPRMSEVESLYHSLVAARVLSDARVAEYASLAGWPPQAEGRR